MTPHEFPVANVVEIDEIRLAGDWLEEVILGLKFKEYDMYVPKATKPAKAYQLIRLFY